MKGISVHTAYSVSKPATASDTAAGRRTVTRAARREHRTILQFPANLDAEMQKANDTLVRARRLRQYVDYLIGKKGPMRG